jgi:hypothetical protein
VTLDSLRAEGCVHNDDDASVGHQDFEGLATAHALKLEQPAAILLPATD